MEMPPWREASTLARASLSLGIASVGLVFGIGFCALVGANQGWLALLGVPLYVCGASSAFLGILGAVLGGLGLIGRQPSRMIQLVGMGLGLAGACTFVFVLNQLGAG